MLNQKNMSRVGNGLAVACAIHCLAMPVLISILPLVGAAFIFNRTFELVLMGGACVCTLASLCWGYRVHGYSRAFAFLIGATLWLMLAQQGDRFHARYSFVGGACLCAANIWNRMLCRTCHHCKDHEHGI